MTELICLCMLKFSLLSLVAAKLTIFHMWEEMVKTGLYD